MHPVTHIYSDQRCYVTNFYCNNVSRCADTKYIMYIGVIYGLLYSNQKYPLSSSNGGQQQFGPPAVSVLFCIYVPW